MAVQTLFSYKNWKPIPHKVIKDQALRDTIHENGYAVIPFLSDERLKAIQALYEQEHAISAQKGGMFYGLYSKDLAYRRRVHDTVADIVKPLLDKHFTQYKNIVNTFITKVSGPESEFYVHQDTSALDEFKHSPLSVWIPLQDITPENGALGVIEKTHWFFSPYRSISIPFPFVAINDTVRSYLKPIYMKAGEAIVFDPRIVHNSMPNTSGSDRRVVLCGVFPQEAEFITCYRDKAPGSAIELIKHEDNFILENTNFYYDCFKRPDGEPVGKEPENFPDMSRETFEELCRINAITKPGEVEGSMSACNFIAEPDGINRFEEVNTQQQSSTVWQRLKAVFS
jgi:hypothetical protein